MSGIVHLSFHGAPACTAKGGRTEERVSARIEIRVVPCTVRAALKWVFETHRHLPKLQGGLFAVACEANYEIVGVGIAGNPSRRAAVRQPRLFAAQGARG